ncbi:MAG: winged helix-turn-helix domain-containing protein [Halobacteria archaeon]|nr:winged helix-turn-helix domain-containing protein [Halobacteria archaeon]
MSETQQNTGEEDMELVDDDNLADNTEMLNFLGDNPRARILTVLVLERGDDISISELCRLAGVSRSTVYKYDIIDDLEKIGAVESRNMAGGKLVKLNSDNDVAQKFVEFGKSLTQNRLGRTR